MIRASSFPGWMRAGSGHPHRRRGVERAGDIGLGDLGQEARIDGVCGPHPGVTVGLQLGSDALARSSPAAARLEDSQQVLHVVPVFVGQDIGLGERAALRAELRLKVGEEPQVEIDTLVRRTVKRAHLGRRRAAARLGVAGEEHRRHHRVATKRLGPVSLDAVHVAHDPAVLRSLRVRSGAALAGHLAGRGGPIDLLAVEGVQLVEHVAGDGAPVATAERQDQAQDQAHDAQAASAEGHGPAAHAAAVLYL